MAVETLSEQSAWLTPPCQSLACARNCVCSCCQLRPKGIQTFAALVCCNAVLGGMIVWFLGRAETHHVS